MKSKDPINRHRRNHRPFRRRARPGRHRSPIVARHGRQAGREGRRDRRRIQRIPVRLQGDARLQGQLHRNHDRRHRGVPRQAAAAHRAGLRGRHRQHDGREGRHLSRLRADGGRGARRSTPATTWLRSPATTPTPRATCCRCHSTAPPRCLYYNRTAFEKAGIDAAPKTWPEVEAAAMKAQAAGYPCGFTTGWQSWVQIENFSAWHDQPIGTKANGFAGMDTEFVFNSPVHVKHIGQLAEWQKSKVFDYGGRRSDSAPKFYGQECVMYMNSSAAYAGVKANAKDFDFAVSALALLARCRGRARRTPSSAARPCGCSRAVTAEEYKGVAKFSQLPVLGRGAGGLAPVPPATSRSPPPPPSSPSRRASTTRTRARTWRSSR